MLANYVNEQQMRKYIIALLIFLPAFSNAQNSDLGNWFMYFGNKKFNNKWNLHHEVQYRNYNFIGDLEQLLLRTGVGYNLTENNNNVLLGYGYILSSNYISDTEKENVSEHRIFQQFITNQSFGRFSLMHRYRFEERFIESDFRFRFRYFLAVRMALNNRKLVDKTFYLSAYNEIFISGDSPVFDRNRLYGALGYQLNNSTRFELGFMNQFLEKNSRDQLNMAVFYNF